MDSEPVDDTISAVPGAWRFNEEVSRAFDSHVRKSVPFYDELQRMVVELSEYFIRDGSVVYDLGSSTGTTLAALAEAHASKEQVQFFGVDLSESMVREAQSKVERSNVMFAHKDIVEVEFSPPPNFVLSLFTLQFLSLSDRRALLRRIGENLIEGGGLLVLEKTRADDSFFEDIWVELYWEFKRRQGLTPEQILDKAHTIRGVLNPLTANENFDLFHQTGFTRVETFFKWYNWSGYLAVKNECSADGNPPAIRPASPKGSPDGDGRPNTGSVR